MALYIAFEGGEGAGKSTQVRLLARRLTEQADRPGVTPLITHEPGGTPLGSQLRQLLLDVGQAPVGARAETLMMAADRAQHMDDVVRPTLSSGRHVISDRTAFSSLAYQGGGRALGVDQVRAVNDWALDGLWPDLVLLLDCPPAAGSERRSRELDRLESEAAGFHDRIRQTFLDLAAADTARWVVLDASLSIAEVGDAVWTVVEARLEQDGLL
jgi:dTMP kinase